MAKNYALMKEFEDICNDIEENIKNDSDYVNGPEYLEHKKRLSRIMVESDGCGCGNRSEMMQNMFKSFEQGRSMNFKTFGPLIIKSFAIDIKKLFKIL